ncbi:MAG: hypothetical protein ACHQEM_04930 [Chitinophagales bacterium]
MKPLFVLIGSSFIGFLLIKIISGENNLALACRIGISAMLIFTAVAHFVFTPGMMMMIPDFIPYKKTLVYLTGFFEMAGAIGLQLEFSRLVTAWLLIAMFVLLLPANIHAAARHIDYQKANYLGTGLNYLWFRVPLQMVFILWIYLSSIHY